ncbi:FHA domain-containing protein [Methanogenium organophilum]|uniref:FHA domain-containing protein n=1 Tax=Methanogenium organophilum TaxID=2199 RepID=A0A9X9S5B8_METOG|nr:FHA domain-containing protein [Methanogenium organophilum]WAI01777.1 FHA domain-containing protein [Methanogenium organophilum]
MTDPEEYANAKTVMMTEDMDYYEDLSRYLNVLSNPVRLHILKIIEHTPKEASEIAADIGTSYVNTKKHLEKMLGAGIITKEAGFGRATSRGSLPVWKYTTRPGGIEEIIRNLGLFSNLDVHIKGSELAEKVDEARRMVSREYAGETPVIFVLGGPADGQTFPLSEEVTRIGREEKRLGPLIDEHGPSAIRYAPPGTLTGDAAIVVHRDFDLVTRISRPHAEIQRKESGWYLTDRGSTGGTYVNDNPCEANHEVRLMAGDIIDLARGPRGVRFLFTVAEVQDDAADE